MTVKSEWEKKATNLLKAELARVGLNYEELSNALAKIGIEKTPQNLNKTINLGKFGFDFFLQCAQAIGLKELRID
jgi:Domain of unknown function (DUF6471)